MARRRYTDLSPAQIADELSALAHDATATFGTLRDTQLNWRPDEASWSIGQCFDHLVRADREMLRAIDTALDPRAEPTVWQRLPLWPQLFGWVLVTSQSPGSGRKYKAPAQARPVPSHVAPDTIARFVEGQQLVMTRVRGLSPSDARRVMVSPFVAQITYSVLNGYRLIAAHQRRHFEQAQRVADHPGFPRVAHG